MPRLVFLAAFVLVSLARGQDGVDQIVRIVHARRLIEILGEVEDFRNAGRAAIQQTSKDFPGTSDALWARVGYEFQSDVFEEALARHYATNLTSDELAVIADKLDRPKMRGLVFWLKQLPPDVSKAEVEERLLDLARKFGSDAVVEMGAFINTALFRQLLATSKSAEKLRREHTDLAFKAALERARTGLLK